MWSLASISMSVLFIVEVVCLFLSFVVFSCAYLFSRSCVRAVARKYVLYWVL